MGGRHSPASPRSTRRMHFEVDTVAQAWRVLEEPGSGPEASTGAHDPASGPGAAAARQVWPLLVIALALVLAVSLWLLGTGASGGDVGVNAAQLTAGGLPAEASAAAGGSQSAGASPSAGAALVVEVNGAVRRPGVYRLSVGARVADAISAAGGFGPRVDSVAARSLNLAAKVADGDQIRVPVRGEGAAMARTAEADAPGVTTGAGTGAGGTVNVNTATSAQLEALPGIGPATAAKIIAARASSPFGTVDELRARKTVGQATFEKIRGLVTVR